MDATMGRLSIGITGVGADAVRLVRPDGGQVEIRAAGAALVTDDPSIRVIGASDAMSCLIEAPEVGVWHVELDGSALAKESPVEVRAYTSSIYRVDETVPAQVRPGEHIALSARTASPGELSDASVRIELTQDQQSVIAAGSVVAAVALADDGRSDDGVALDGVYGGSHVVRDYEGNLRYRVTLEGRDGEGNPVHRESDGAIFVQGDSPDRLTSTEPGKVWDPAMWSNGFVSLVDSNGNVLERRQVKGVAAEGNSLLFSRPWSVAPGTYSYILRNRSAYNCLFVEDEYDAGVVEDAYNSEGRGSLVDGAKHWTPDAFAGSSVWIAEGPGEGATSMKILSNTENALVLEELWDAMPERTSVYVIAKEFKPVQHVAAPRTVHAVMMHPLLKAYNENRQGILDMIPGKLAAGIAVIRVPTLYEPKSWVGNLAPQIPSRSYLPNLVNLLQDGGKLVMPKTFCKIGGGDIFEDYIRANLVGYEPEFVDSWLWHEQGGEVHCSTNAQRKPLNGGRWW